MKVPSHAIVMMISESKANTCQTVMMQVTYAAALWLDANIVQLIKTYATGNTCSTSGSKDLAMPASLSTFCEQALSRTSRDKSGTSISSHLIKPSTAASCNSRAICTTPTHSWESWPQCRPTKKETSTRSRSKTWTRSKNNGCGTSCQIIGMLWWAGCWLSLASLWPWSWRKLSPFTTTQKWH